MHLDGVEKVLAQRVAFGAATRDVLLALCVQAPTHDWCIDIATLTLSDASVLGFRQKRIALVVNGRACHRHVYGGGLGGIDRRYGRLEC